MLPIPSDLIVSRYTLQGRAHGQVAGCREWIEDEIKNHPELSLTAGASEVRQQSCEMSRVS